MRTMLGLLGSTLLSGLGWWLGARLDLAVAIVLGAVGAGVGLYYGRRFYDDWLG